MLGNSPRQQTVITLETAKSFAFGLQFKMADTEQPVDLTGASVRLAVVEPAWQGGAQLLDLDAEIVDAALGLAQFDLQAADLDLAAGEYPYAITLTSQHGYSTLIMKGVLDIRENADADISNTYAGHNPSTQLAAYLNGGGLVEVRVAQLDGMAMLVQGLVTSFTAQVDDQLAAQAAQVDSLNSAHTVEIQTIKTEVEGLQLAAEAAADEAAASVTSAEQAASDAAASAQQAADVAAGELDPAIAALVEDDASATAAAVATRIGETTPAAHTHPTTDVVGLDEALANAGGAGLFRGEWDGASPAADGPYMLGEFVIHSGKLWKSDADNNSGEPGTSGWTEVPLDYAAADHTHQATEVQVAAAGGLSQGALQTVLEDLDARLSAISDRVTALEPSPVEGAAIGDPVLGGFFAGIIDTTQGNIIAADAYQTGQRYALIVSDKSLETTLKWKTTNTSTPEAQTRWDGLSVTRATNTPEYPAAQYCMGLSYPADGASEWYMPAMDELELIYRNLKSTTEPNSVDIDSGSAFPGVDQPYGYNPSSDPAGAAYTSTDPAQTSVAAFQDGGGQDLGDAGAVSYYASSSEYAANEHWTRFVSGSIAGHPGHNSKAGPLLIRPVRRYLL